jgi:hypothetical protein
MHACNVFKALPILFCLPENILAIGTMVFLPTREQQVVPAFSDSSTAEIIDRFTLPRHIQIDDNDPKWTVSATIGLHKTILESQTKCCFLLFTLDYEVSEQTHEIQVEDNINCCKLVDPSVVKLRRRIENSHFV